MKVAVAGHRRLACFFAKSQVLGHGSRKMIMQSPLPLQHDEAVLSWFTLSKLAAANLGEYISLQEVKKLHGTNPRRQAFLYDFFFFIKL